MQNKLQNVQALRAFAVLLVVGLHLLAIEIKYNQFQEVLLPAFFRIGISGVDLFFVISGFIMVSVTADFKLGSLIDRKTSSWRFFYMRLSRIFPLYWLVSGAILLVFINYPNFFKLPHFDLEYILRSFLLLPQASLPILMVGWSLIHEFYFYIVFALFLLLPRKYLPYLLLGWSLVVIEGSRHVSPFNPDQNQFARIAFSPVTIEFIAGCYLAWFMQHLQHVSPGVRYALARFCFFSGLIALPIVWHFFSFNTTTIDVTGWIRVLLFTAPYLLMLYGAVGMEHNKQGSAPKGLVVIGDASYSIYLTHILILAACGRVWQLFAWQGYTDNLIMILVMLIAVLVGGYGCYRYIEKPLLNLSRRIS